MKQVTDTALWNSLLGAEIRNRADVNIEFPTIYPYEGGAIGLSYSADEIINTSAVTEIDPISRRLPTETFTFTIEDYAGHYNPDNPNTFSAQFTKGIELRVYYGMYKNDGTITYPTDYDVYYLTDKPSVSNHQVTFSAQSRLAVMIEREDLYRQRITDRFSSGSAILQPMGQIANFIGKDYYDVASLSGLCDFSEINAVSTFPTQGGCVAEDTHANALLEVAHACGAMLYTKRDIVTIKQSDVVKAGTPTSVATVDKNSIYEGTLTVDNTAKLRYVQMNAKDYYYADKKTNVLLYEGSVNKVGNDTTLTVTVDLDENDITLANSNGIKYFSVISDTTSVTATLAVNNVSTVYTHSIDINIAFTGSATSANIKLYAGLMRPKDFICVYSAQAEGESADVFAAGSDDIENSNLITPLYGLQAGERDYIESAAGFFMRYLRKQKTYEFDYRGNPLLECGDIINIQTDYSASIQAVVLRHELNYNGAYSGKMIVKVV